MNIYDILTSDRIVENININIDYLLGVIPELAIMMNFNHKHPHHHLNVWNHTLLALSLSESNFIIRMTLLLHDIGKPICYKEKDGIRHYNGHNLVSSEIASNILKRLNISENISNEIVKLIKYHDYPITDEMIEDDYEFTSKLYKIQICDALAHHPDKLEKRIEYLTKVQNKILKNKVI